jgi:hypothetical protein
LEKIGDMAESSSQDAGPGREEKTLVLLFNISNIVQPCWSCWLCKSIDAVRDIGEIATFSPIGRVEIGIRPWLTGRGPPNSVKLRPPEDIRISDFN